MKLMAFDIATVSVFVKPWTSVYNPTGISDAQKDALKALGAIDLERHQTHRAGQGQTAAHH